MSETSFEKITKDTETLIKQGEGLLSLRPANGSAFRQVEKDVNTWLQVCRRTYLNALSTEYGTIFAKSIKPYSVGPFINIGAQIVGIETKRKKHNLEVRRRLEVLKDNLNLIRVSDVIINPEVIIVENRAHLSVQDRMSFVLKKLGELKDGKYYSVNYILKANGVNVSAPEVKEMAQKLIRNQFITVKSDPANPNITKARITLEGQEHLETLMNTKSQLPMNYNLYISVWDGSYNVFEINEEKLKIAVTAYLEGKTSFTISGKTHYLSKVREFKIFTLEGGKNHKEAIDYYMNNIHFSKKRKGSHFLPPATLEKMGKDVTDQFLGNKEFGAHSQKIVGTETTSINKEFVNESRIQELKNLKNPKLDFTKLIQYCTEINDNYSRGNYLSVAMIGRSIINHVPPVFGFKTFNEVCGQYGSKSFKKSMDHLNNSMKNIADSFLHETIRKSEVLPNSTQVNFSQDLDVLLAEVVRVSKKLIL